MALSIDLPLITGTVQLAEQALGSWHSALHSRLSVTLMSCGGCRDAMSSPLTLTIKQRKTTRQNEFAARVNQAKHSHEHDDIRIYRITATTTIYARALRQRGADCE